MTDEPLFVAPARPADLARIEAEARALRAQAMRDGLAWIAARLVALLRPATGAARPA